MLPEKLWHSHDPVRNYAGFVGADIVTSRDVNMTSSPICVIKMRTAELIFALIPPTYIFPKRTPQGKKVMALSDFDDVIKDITSL